MFYNVIRTMWRTVLHFYSLRGLKIIGAQNATHYTTLKYYLHDVLWWVCSLFRVRCWVIMKTPYLSQTDQLYRIIKYATSVWYNTFLVWYTNHNQCSTNRKIIKDSYYFDSHSYCSSFTSYFTTVCLKNKIVTHLL